MNYIVKREEHFILLHRVDTGRSHMVLVSGNSVPSERKRSKAKSKILIPSRATVPNSLVGFESLGRLQLTKAVRIARKEQTR